jgi:hypothetical protein
MFRIRRVVCVLCRDRASGGEAIRGCAATGVMVCRACYEEWERAGRYCAGCRTRVGADQEVGVFMDREGFGHAECGAIWLAVS